MRVLLGHERALHGDEIEWRGLRWQRRHRHEQAVIAHAAHAALLQDLVRRRRLLLQGLAHLD